MARKAGTDPSKIQIPQVAFDAQATHFMNLLRHHQSLNQTPVTKFKDWATQMWLGQDAQATKPRRVVKSIRFDSKSQLCASRHGFYGYFDPPSGKKKE